MARLLLIEDDKGNRRLLQAMLLKLDHTVETIADGETALRVLGIDDGDGSKEEPAFDLVLLDIKLPGIDGLEVIRRVRAAGLTDLPVVAVTALALPGDRQKCLAAGCDGYLSKPITLQALQEELERWLSSARR